MYNIFLKIGNGNWLNVYRDKIEECAKYVKIWNMNEQDYLILPVGYEVKPLTT